MDIIVSIILVALGLLVILASLASAFRTVVLPRAAFDPMTRVVFLGFRRVLLAVSRISPNHFSRETVLSTHAPLGLLTLAVTWALGIMLGFTLLFLATGTLDAGNSFVLAGSSFTTLGFYPPDSAIHDVLSIAAAVLGLGVVALLISYLPTIYGLFSRREVVVADIAIKSGGVAHGPALVRHMARDGIVARIDEMWVEWGHWMIAVGETHTSEPSLNFFRSPRAQRSWLTAATAVLDAAVLRNVLVDAPFSIRADMTHRAGVEAVVSIAHFFFVRPAGSNEHYTVLTRADFDAEVAELQEVGVPLVDDLDAAWEAFAKLRSAYEPHIMGMAKLILPPPAPWVSGLFEREVPKPPHWS